MLSKSKSRNFGIYRDRLICEAVSKMRCLSTEQVRILFFNNLKIESAKRQSKHRLLILSGGTKDNPRDKKLNRFRAIKDESYVYFNKKYEQIEHIVYMNWMFLWYLNQSDLQIKHLEYEKKNFEIVRPDIYIVTYNPFKFEYDSICFEMDYTTSNDFDKVKKYNLLYEKKVADEWTIKCNKFPQIIIATMNKRRLINIQDRIRKENKYPYIIKYSVYLIEDMMEVCLNENIKNNLNSSFLSLS